MADVITKPEPTMVGKPDRQEDSSEMFPVEVAVRPAFQNRQDELA